MGVLLTDTDPEAGVLHLQVACNISDSSECLGFLGAALLRCVSFGCPNLTAHRAKTMLLRCTIE